MLGRQFHSCDEPRLYFTIAVTILAKGHFFYPIGDEAEVAVQAVLGRNSRLAWPVCCPETCTEPRENLE